VLPRIFTTLVAVPVILACIYTGGAVFLVLVLVLAVFSINEFYNMMQKKDFHPAYWLGNFFTLFFIIFAYYALRKNWEPAHSAILTGSALATMVATLFLKQRPKEAIVDIAVTLLGMIYIGWFFSYFLFIRALNDGSAYMFFLCGTIWALDVVAYLVGSRFGRHRLFPSVSPKKSIEGALAGFAVCLIAAGVFGYYAGFSLLHSLVLGGLLGVVAQVSDLVESLIKRDVGVKDSGAILPGHGGFLDRMDSFILTAPVMYYYLVWVILK